MSHENPESLNDLESALAALPPVQSSIDRDRLMFLAGRAAAEAELQQTRPRRASVWLWPAATVGMSAVAMLLGILLIFPSQHEPAPVAVPTQDRREHDEASPPRDDPALAKSPAMPQSLPLEDYLLPHKRISLGVGVVPRSAPADIRSGESENWMPRSPQLLDELLGG